MQNQPRQLGPAPAENPAASMSSGTALGGSGTARTWNRVHFSSASDEWATPAETFAALDAEFGFVDDACPLGGNRNGLMREWGSPCFVNPPYSEIGPWMEKAKLEADAGKTVVLLVPSRTDTRWWHLYAMKATEIRFIRGRLKFGSAKTGAPFPSCVVVFSPPTRDGGSGGACE